MNHMKWALMTKIECDDDRIYQWYNKMELQMSKGGKLYNNTRNVLIFMHKCYKGAFWYDEERKCIMTTFGQEKGSVELTEEIVTGFQVVLQKVFITVTRKRIRECIGVYAAVKDKRKWMEAP